MPANLKNQALTGPIFNLAVKSSRVYFMKNELNVKREITLTPYFFAVLDFISRLWQKEKKTTGTIKQPYSNQEKLFSVDIFDFSHAKWGWIYAWNPKTNRYVVQDVLPFCTHCDLPMQYEGNPFINAFCPGCKRQKRSFNYPILQSKTRILAEIIKRYSTENYLDITPEDDFENQYYLSAVPR